MDDKLPRIQELYEKNFQAFCYPDEVRLTRKERKDLEDYFRGQSEISRSMHPEEFWTMLIVSHPGYGKPDKYGIVKII